MLPYYSWKTIVIGISKFCKKNSEDKTPHIDTVKGIKKPSSLWPSSDQTTAKYTKCIKLIRINKVREMLTFKGNL